MAIKIKQFTMYRWDGKIKWSHKTKQIVTTNNVMSYATLGEEKEKSCAPTFEAWQYRIWKQSSCMKHDNIGETYAIQLYPIRWFNYNLKWTKWKLHPKSDNYSFWKKRKKEKINLLSFCAQVLHKFVERKKKWKCSRKQQSSPPPIRIARSIFPCKFKHM